MSDGGFNVKNLQIEKGYPVPRTDQPSWKDLLDRMESGDSVVLPHLKARQFKGSVFTNHPPWRIVVRRINDRQSRCWKVYRMKRDRT